MTAQTRTSSGLPAVSVGRTHGSDLVRTPGPVTPGRIVRLVGEILERRRQRRALARLDARMLEDIGLTPDDVAGELDKPFWR